MFLFVEFNMFMLLEFSLFDFDFICWNWQNQTREEFQCIEMYLIRHWVSKLKVGNISDWHFISASFLFTQYSRENDDN